MKCSRCNREVILTAPFTNTIRIYKTETDYIEDIYCDAHYEERVSRFAKNPPKNISIKDHIITINLF